MSRKLTAMIVGLFASVALAAGTMQGCGSSSSSGDNVALCQKTCDKALECTPDAGSIGQQAATQCKMNCTTQVPNTHCSNESAIASALNACLPMACDAYLNCLTTTVPDCQSTTGTGGNGGTTGNGGAGGSGGGDCSVCTKADACCTALASGTACNLKTMCDSAGADAKPSYISACQSVLDTVAGNPQAPAACQ
jgi:hypothetical protein